VESWKHGDDDGGGDDAGMEARSVTVVVEGSSSGYVKCEDGEVWEVRMLGDVGGKTADKTADMVAAFGAGLVEGTVGCTVGCIAEEPVAGLEDTIGIVEEDNLTELGPGCAPRCCGSRCSILVLPCLFL
jgi:hypothetical protein